MNEFLRILIDLDVPAAQRAGEAIGVTGSLETLHLARTMSEDVPTKLRVYSHEWLVERRLPSHLPNEMKPKPEQVEQRIVSAVGISVHSELPGVEEAVRGAMERAVLDAYAGGNEDPDFVKARMNEAKARELRALGLTPPHG